MPLTEEVAKGHSGHGGIRSLAQARAMFAARSGHSTLGIPQSVGEEMTAGAGHGAHPGLLHGLPQHVRGGMKKIGKVRHV